MKDLGIAEIVPAMCRLDYSMSEASGTSEFVRQYTLASGGPYCDCGYKKIMISKMTSAQTIMKKKALIKAEIDSLLPGNQSDVLWRKATNKLAMLLDRYASLPKGERVHTESFILPAAAIYLTAKEEIGQPMAYRVIEEAAIKGSESTAKKLAILMRVPGMPGLFVKIWDPMTRKMFGGKSGFKNVFYPKKKGEYRMDIVSCPYFRYFTELGCPELTKIFCANDDRIYGSLPGLKFERTTTLGRGGERCDFYLKRQRNRKRRKHR